MIQENKYPTIVIVNTVITLSFAVKIDDVGWTTAIHRKYWSLKVERVGELPGRGDTIDSSYES